MRHAGISFIALLLGLPSFALADLEGVNHAEVCGRCHRDILKAWKESSHSRAMENPLFQDVLERAEQAGGAGARNLCLTCHAPTVAHTGDRALKTKASWEGVTCDYCHSVKAVEVQGDTAHAIVKFDGIKTGPLGDASAPQHGTAFSDVHTTSLICAPCHQYQNPEGFAVLTTYSEWEQSDQGRQGVNCQGCHMGETSANVVDPKVKRLTRSTVNLHSMPGSRSVDQLNKALRARVHTARSGDKLTVEVELWNRGAGHMAPTGSPLRRLHLNVSVSAGGQTQEQEKVYQRRVAGSDGQELKSEELVFLKASRTLDDTRLKPGEHRREIFGFSVAANQAARVRARLSYSYSPRASGPGSERLNFLSLPSYAPPVR
jgi:hypothetical protein